MNIISNIYNKTDSNNQIYKKISTEEFKKSYLIKKKKV